jgi:small conductance mechanosensitive channel
MMDLNELTHFNVSMIWTQLVSIVTAYGLNILAAIVIFLAGRWLARFIARMTDGVMTKAGIDRAIVSFVQNLVYTAILVFVVIAALSKLGIQTASFVAVLGAAGLAIGLALQGSLSNFAAGVLLILFRPFKEGDYIEAAGTAGIVEQIMMFATQLRTPDNKRIIVPNSSVTGGNIVNYSANQTRRVELKIGVSYAADLQQVRAQLQHVVAGEKRILPGQEVTIGIAELGASAVNFTLQVWVNASDYAAVVLDLNESIKNAFDAANIVIPFPQMDVHVTQLRNA